MQRDIREVVCDNLLEHQTRLKADKIIDGKMPTGWKHMSLVMDNNVLEDFDACSPACAAAIAARIIRNTAYGMSE